jgi:hypothetical protein
MDSLRCRYLFFGRVGMVEKELEDGQNTTGREPVPTKSKPKGHEP